MSGQWYVYDSFKPLGDIFIAKATVELGVGKRTVALRYQMLQLLRKQPTDGDLDPRYVANHHPDPLLAR